MINWFKNFLCWIGFHWDSHVEEAVVILSVYRREECHWCKDVSYYVMGFGGIDRVDFVPLPWSEEEQKEQV